MDLWVVAAAAGAGYVAKFLKKSKETEGLVESILEESNGKSNSNTLFEQFLDKTCPVQRLGGRVLQRENDIEEGVPSSLGTRRSDGVVDSEVASTSGFEDEMPVNHRSIEDCNVLSLSSLSSRFSEEDRMRGSSDIADKSSYRSKSGIRAKNLRRHSVKPLSSLDSCLIAQLYNEHVEMEEYVFSAFPSPSRSTARPLLVTDGSRIISRASSDSCSLHNNLYKEDGFYSNVKETAVGVPPLPEFSPLKPSMKPKQKIAKGFQGRLSSSSKKVSGKQLQSQGSTERMFLFCLGITFGVMSTVMMNRREVDRLKELLKQTENLVQDLHEELEMKDSLTVKVLAHEGNESQENNGHYLANHALNSLSSTIEVKESLECDTERPEAPELGENSESRSKIEAELEAELERLEFNISASCLERRLSGLGELDPDSMVDIVQGELRVDMVNGGAGYRIDSDKDISGTSTTETENVNYAVSPRELSLRLHEVIQSRMQERIMELETALENSQKRLHTIESKQINSWRNYSNSEMGSSSQGSPTMREESNTITQPLFLNLSDDALDAYNEAYEALNTRIIGMDEESPPFMTCKSNQFKEELHSSDCSVLWSQNGVEESRSGSNEVFKVQDESDDGDDDDDEMGRLLIKQIVEKTRQGSPVVLNAQRMLFSVDEKAPFE